MDDFNTSLPNNFVMEKLKTEKARTKGAFTRTKTKLLMSMEGGLSPKVKVMESLDNFAIAFENVIDACARLQLYYEDIVDRERFLAVSCEMEAMEQDFNETEQLVKGYLNGSQGNTSDFSRPEPTGKSSRTEFESSRTDRRTEKLQDEIVKAKEEINRIAQDLERTYLECEKELNKKLMEHNQQSGERSKQTLGVSGEQSEQTTKGSLSFPSENATPKVEPMVPLNEREYSLRSTGTPSALRKSEALTKMPSGVPLVSAGVVSSTPNILQSLESNKVSSGVEHVQNQPKISLDPKVGNCVPTQFVTAAHSHASIGTRVEPHLSQELTPSTTPAANQPSRSTTDHLSADALLSLKRVSVPKFSGNKSYYEAWKAAFNSCVDKGSAPPEYKLLRLRECLQGEPLRMVENLGHSATAYEAAKLRLERKYGGKHRALTLRMEELDAFKPIRDGNEKDLEGLAELLDAIVVNLTDAGQQAELGSGSLYTTIQRKLSKNLLAKYKQWFSDNYRDGNVQTLREFIDRESEFLTTASEIITGVGKSSVKQLKPSAVGRTYVTQERPTISGPRRRDIKKCKLCNHPHGLWACDSFRKMTVNQRWDIAREQRVCFRCLSYGHQGEACVRSRICGLNGCRSAHHRLLHDENSVGLRSRDNNRREESESQPAQDESVLRPLSGGVTTEGELNARTHTTTLVTAPLSTPKIVALRTVPVYVTNGARRVKVNALLDEASSKSYLNSDVAAELRLEGSPHELIVNVLNGRHTALDTSLVEFVINSLDGSTSETVSAYTTERVTGNMHVVDWNLYKSKWTHLQLIDFPEPGPRPIADLLIGADHSDLLYSLRDVRGKPGEPVARRTPLGWTCLGSPEMDPGAPQTNFTFLVNDSSTLDRLIRRYWDIAEPQLTQIVNPDEKLAQNIVANSLTFADDHYTIGMPWKQNRCPLPDNFNMALHRLQKTEKRLLKSPEIGEAYKEVLQTYKEKGYIHKVSPKEIRPDQVWYLPHFPVFRPDKSTTKTRIVFDASARFNDVSLNDIVLQGPKLQNDLFAVLLRFRRDPVALMCDIREMYLQIKLRREDQPYHRFLWRDLQIDREPDIYEFDRVVFGVNSSPFQAQFVAQEHARQHQSEYPLAAETILESTYMDDSMDSVPDVKTGVEL